MKKSTKTLQILDVDIKINQQTALYGFGESQLISDYFLTLLLYVHLNGSLV